MTAMMRATTPGQISAATLAVVTVVVASLAATAGALSEAQLTGMTCNGTSAANQSWALLCTEGAVPEKPETPPHAENWDKILKDPWIWLGVVLFLLSRARAIALKVCHDEDVPKPDKVFGVTSRNPPLDQLEPRQVEVQKDPDAFYEFDIVLERSFADSDGLGFDILEEGSALRIQSFGTGMLTDWNEANPTKEVKFGDRIVEINSVKGKGKALLKESSAQKLEITISREKASEDDPESLGLEQAVALAYHDQWIRVETSLLTLLKFVGFDLVMIGVFQAGCFNYLLLALVIYSLGKNAANIWVPLHDLAMEAEERGENQIGVVSFTATNVYMALNENFAKVCFRFAAQILLAGLYVFSMWSKSHHPETVAVENWFSVSLNDVKIPWWACIFLQISADTQMSKSFATHAKLWAYITKAIYKKKNPHPAEVDRSVHEVYDQMYDLQDQDGLKRKMRCFFAFICHGLVFDIIIYTMPLLLIQSELYIDFVKDSFAVTFIVMLDDVDQSKETEIVCPVMAPIEIKYI